jgi:hypothetical protein
VLEVLRIDSYGIGLDDYGDQDCCFRAGLNNPDTVLLYARVRYALQKIIN